MAYIQNKRIVIAKVRVSGGHLCEAKAPTEPAGETAARRAAIRTPLSLRGALAPWQSVSLLRGIRILSRLSLLRRPPLLAFSCTAGARNVTQNDKENKKRNVTRNDKIFI